MLIFISRIETLFASFILSSSCPKEINRVYDYRTKKAMSDQTLWDFVQKYSAKILSRTAILNIIVGLILMIFVTYSNDNDQFLTEIKLSQMEKSL